MDVSDLGVVLNFIKLKNELEKHKQDSKELLLLVTYYSKMGLYTSSIKTKDEVIKTLCEMMCKTIKDRDDAMTIVTDEVIKMCGILIKLKNELKELQDEMNGLAEDSEDM